MAHLVVSSLYSFIGHSYPFVGHFCICLWTPFLSQISILVYKMYISSPTICGTLALKYYRLLPLSVGLSAFGRDLSNRFVTPKDPLLVLTHFWNKNYHI